MTTRIGGLMDYSKLMPTTDTSATVAEHARRMRLDGLSLHDIASALRVHPEQVRRWLASLEHREAAKAHAQAWRPGP